MSVYIHELLCVDSAGNVSVVHLTIEDNDNALTSQEADAIYTLDGDQLASAPAVFTKSALVTFLDGSSHSVIAMSFDQNGNQYFMLNPDYPADSIAGIQTFTTYGEVGGILYTVYGASDSTTPRPYQGKALIQYFTDANVPIATQIGTVTVYDDDKKIEFNGLNGAPNSETGAAAVGHFSYQGQEHPFNDTDAGAGDTHMVLVRVDYDGSAGTGSFEAIKYFYDLGPDYAVAYIPRAGSVDLADVQTVTGVTVLATSLDGELYSGFGLGFATTLTEGSAAGDLLSGTWLHDKFKGLGGADTLVGSMGEDKLYGGAGADWLYGGMHDDTLDGGSGVDVLFGRSYDDSLSGGDGDDSLFGGWGNDTLDGGKKADSLEGNEDNDVLTGGNGADTLLGGAGDDTLDGGGDNDDLRGGFGNDQITDGNGQDTVTGSSGADTFIFGKDGSTDTIADFNDGVDLIDLTTPYKDLVFTDIAPGEVHVEHAGETLIIFGNTGTLTSADLTRADFI